MGVIDRDRLCPTDLNSSEICPGYHGHIRLAAPVYYSTHFMAQILKTLRCICIRCSSILVDKTDEGLIKKLLKKTVIIVLRLFMNIQLRTKTMSCM